MAQLLAHQIEAADLIVLNKVDLLRHGSSAASAGAEDPHTLLRALNPRAAMLRTSHGVVDEEVLLGLQQLTSSSEQLAAAESDGHEHHKEHHHVHHHEHHHHHHEHGEKCDGCSATSNSSDVAAEHIHFESFVFCSTEAFDLGKFREVLEAELLPRGYAIIVEGGESAASCSGVASSPPSSSPLLRVLRAKGFIWFGEGEAPCHYYLSWVAQRIELSRHEMPHQQTPSTELVFIGQEMEESRISALLQRARLC